jgi:hypothetical protein
MGFKSFFKAPLKAIAAVFGKGPWADEYAKVLGFVEPALNAASFVALGTDNTSDDDFINFIRVYTGKKVSLQDVKDAGRKKDLLRLAARAVMVGQLKAESGGPLPADRIINAALELAVVRLKAGK